MSPSSEPRLPTPLGGKDSPYTPKTPTSRNTAISLRPERRVETSHEIAFLLRHFAEGPGYW
jgi:RNA:NAD 2'-phosphotransferase (TPT1/KptA family)